MKEKLKTIVDKYLKKSNIEKYNHYNRTNNLLNRYISCIVEGSYRPYMASKTYSRLNTLFLPNKGKKGERPLYFILHDLGQKICYKCNTLLFLTDFRKNNSMSDNVQGWCKSCHYKDTKIRQSAISNKRRANKINRTPNWAELDNIKEFYIDCPKGYHVDHIIPLQGKLVSGLHVLKNLQYLTKEENLQKKKKK